MFSRSIFFIYILLLGIVSISSSFASEKPFRILHVMSYHSSWVWNIEQLQGFKDGLKNINVEYKVIELDTKRESNPNVISKKIEETKKIISNWKPNLLYTNDDNAQKYIAQSYVGTSLPIVFSGVNRDPSEYGFLGAKNVTGVMEYEHFIPTLNLLHSIKKDIKRIAVIVDSDPTWKGVTSRMKATLKDTQAIEVSDWILIEKLSDYKMKIKELENKVDAIALLGIFNIKDESGNNVGYEEILKWTSKNSDIPDFSFWESRVDLGTLCAVSVSGYEQGLEAGKIARKILVEGVAPSSIKITSSKKGQPMINLARAKDLELKIDVQILLNSKVKKNYTWDK